MTNAETTAILERVPLRLRNEYAASWDAYASTCCTGGTREQRAYAYEKARGMEDRLQEAIRVAAEEQKRHIQRHAAHS